MRFFNTAGPVNAAEHYVIPPLSRLNLDEIELLLLQKKYSVLHAPRQTGKTSMLMALMAKLNGEGQYRCLYVNVEPPQTAHSDVDAGVRTILGAIAGAAGIYLNETRITDWNRAILANESPHHALNALLTTWCRASDRPIVLLIDEVDALVGDTLISLLRQIRAGYNQRPDAFPQSIVLCGVRDVRDYRIHTSDHEIITGGSAFNIKAKSLRLGNFTQEEISRLYRQHTDQTGQAFAAGISRTGLARYPWSAVAGQCLGLRGLFRNGSRQGPAADDHPGPL